MNWDLPQLLVIIETQMMKFFKNHFSVLNTFNILKTGINLNYHTFIGYSEIALKSLQTLHPLLFQ
jgi:hypothetical protein